MAGHGNKELTKHARENANLRREISRAARPRSERGAMRRQRPLAAHERRAEEPKKSWTGYLLVDVDRPNNSCFYIRTQIFNMTKFDSQLDLINELMLCIYIYIYINADTF